jgi:hypothetical protein
LDALPAAFLSHAKSIINIAAALRDLFKLRCHPL